jgi:hypothetical protein
MLQLAADYYRKAIQAEAFEIQKPAPDGMLGILQGSI